MFRKSLLKMFLQKMIILFNRKSDWCTGECWSTFQRIRDKEGNTEAFVACRRCLSLLAYDRRKVGTSPLITDAKSCRATQPNSNHNITTMFSGPTISNISAEAIGIVTEALAEVCVKDIYEHLKL